MGEGECDYFELKTTTVITLAFKGVTKVNGVWNILGRRGFSSM